MAYAGGGETGAPYLASGELIDSDHPALAAYAHAAGRGCDGEPDFSGRPYYAVRDDIRYHPHGIDTGRKDFRASRCLAPRRGFRVTAAALLAVLGADPFVCHGYTELMIEERWSRLPRRSTGRFAAASVSDRSTSTAVPTLSFVRSIGPSEAHGICRRTRPLCRCTL